MEEKGEDSLGVVNILKVLEYYCDFLMIRWRGEEIVGNLKLGVGLSPGFKHWSTLDSVI